MADVHDDLFDRYHHYYEMQYHIYPKISFYTWCVLDDG